MDGGILIGRAQFDYHFTPIENHHFMITAGIFEDMFSGWCWNIYILSKYQLCSWI